MKKTICAGGFLMRKNKFLFGKRCKNKIWAPGLWDIAGGKSLKYEHPFLTLARETFEEIGVMVLNAELLSCVNVADDSKAGFFEYNIYMITAFKGMPINCSNEHTKIKWFSREELNEISLASPLYLSLIDQWFKRNPGHK